MGKSTIERDWTTPSGLRAICVVTGMGHRCGYVEIPESHWLHGVEYNDTIPGSVQTTLAGEMIGKRGPIDVFCMMGTEFRAGYLFDVHGSITFTGTPYAGDVEGFWYGFDCNHDIDRDNPKSEEYVVAECERLAEQIAVKWATAPQDRKEESDG